MAEKTTKKIELIKILGLELNKQNESLEQLATLRIGLLGQLNSIVQIKRLQQNKYQLRNENNLNSFDYNMEKHYAGFNYWRNA